MFFRSRSDSARWICQSEWVLTSRGDDKSSNSRISQISHHLSLKKTVVSARFLCQFGQELTDSPHLPTNYSQTIPKSVDFSHLSHVFLRCFHENPREWTCNVATHRGTAELRCQALDRPWGIDLFLGMALTVKNGYSSILWNSNMMDI